MDLNERIDIFINVLFVEYAKVGLIVLSFIAVGLLMAFIVDLIEKGNK